MPKLSFTNKDHDGVAVCLRGPGINQNVTLKRGSPAHELDSGRDPVKYAWRAKDETIKDEEIQAYGVTLNVDVNIVYGNPVQGKVPVA